MSPIRSEIKSLLGDDVELNAGVPRILELSPKGMEIAE